MTKCWENCTNILLTYKFIIAPSAEFVKFFRGDLLNLAISRFLSRRFVQTAEPESCTEEMSDFTDKRCNLCKQAIKWQFISQSCIAIGIAVCYNKNADERYPSFPHQERHADERFFQPPLSLKALSFPEASAWTGANAGTHLLLWKSLLRRWFFFCIRLPAVQTA